MAVAAASVTTPTTVASVAASPATLACVASAPASGQKLGVLFL